MVEAVPNRVLSTDESRLAEQIIFLLLITVTVICLFVGGFWAGQRIMGESMQNYYEEYMNESCTCIQFQREFNNFSLQLGLTNS